MFKYTLFNLIIDLQSVERYEVSPNRLIKFINLDNMKELC